MLRKTLSTLLLLFLVACAVNPATGRRELVLMSESQEIAMGREADAQLAGSFGLVEDEALARYVSELGQEMAAVSERPDLPWTFRVVDDPTVNAFALPGGFVYMTRGILAHFETEAELAGVLGHEIGHVTARHSVTQMSRQQLQQIGLGLGMIFSEDLRRFGGAAGSLLQIMNLGYSRGDESESDELGLRYMNRLNYDPDEILGVFQMLARVSGGAEGRLPEWQSTHPYPENRERDIRALIQESNIDRDGIVARDRYLDRLDGMKYGQDPREGFFLENRFVHPELAFEMLMPRGWAGINRRDVVAGMSPSEDAIVTLSLASGAADPSSALSEFLGQEGITAGPTQRGGTRAIPTYAADFQAATEGGSVRGRVAFLTHEGVVFRLMGYTSEDRYGTYRGEIGAFLDSFDRLTDGAILSVQPWALRIETVGAATTLDALHSSWNPPISLEEFARLNRVEPGATLAAGSRVKRVVGQPYR